MDSDMAIDAVSGYAGKILRVDLTRGQTTEEAVDKGILRKYLGGTGLGIKLLYEEVPPNVRLATVAWTLRFTV